MRLYNKKSTRSSCLMKLDLMKACDTMNWDFIQQLLEGVDFPIHYVDLIMTCIKTPKFSLM